MRLQPNNAEVYLDIRKASALLSHNPFLENSITCKEQHDHVGPIIPRQTDSVK